MGSHLLDASKSLKLRSQNINKATFEASTEALTAKQF
jgi:hypothetical protein